MTSAIEQFWPPFGLTITSGALTMSPVRDDDLPELVDLALAGVHDPGRMPFYFPWTDAPDGELPANMLQYHWSLRTNMSPELWTLEMAVRYDGDLVGCQGVSTAHYPVTRTGETGSWLGRAHQGQGIGTRMRQALCVFMFDWMDAEEITSAAFVDNPSSLAVSRKVGYSENGHVRLKRRDGEMAVNRKLVLTPSDFVRPAGDVQVTGAGPLRDFLGLGK